MGTNRTFLITGASKGIGRALSQRLADAGYHVVGVARGKDPGSPGTLVSVDFGDSRASGEAFADLARRYCFDGLVNSKMRSRMPTRCSISWGRNANTFVSSYSPGRQTDLHRVPA